MPNSFLIIDFKWTALFCCLFLNIWACTGDSQTNDSAKNDAKSQKKTTTEKKETPLQSLTKQIEADTTNADLYYQRCRLYIAESELQGAANDILKALELAPDNAKYYETASALLLQINDSRSAINMLQRGLEIKPKDIPLRLQLAKVFLIVKNFTSANENLDLVLQFDPENPEAYLFKSLIAKEKGERRASIGYLEKAVQSDPDFYDGHLQLGLFYSEKDNPIALDYLNNAIRIQPKSVEALYAKGIYLQQTDQIGEAKAVYRKIVKIDPQYEYAFYNIGFLLYLQDSLALAEKHFDIATKVAPSYANAYQMRGLMAERQGKNEQAIRDYEQCLIFEENHEKALEGIKRVKEN